MDIIIIVTAIVSFINLILLGALFFRRSGKEENGIHDVRFSALTENIDRAFAAQNRRIDDMTKYTSSALRDFSAANERALQEMRYVVDEKLNSTLEKRLEGSYRIIADNLNKVALGIGEVNRLADSVGDIKKLFSNVKNRGTWGEIRLDGLLSDLLAPEQYVRNCRLHTGVDSFVDFAIVMPDKNGNKTYLPVDAKFPAEEYARLISAETEESARAAERGFAAAVRKQADSICEKYIYPPLTTDFAIMYFPTEGLFAETVRNPELSAYLYKKRIMPCGPGNLYALLSSLQVGFKTVAIEKRSRELWRLLAVFKSEFVKFSALLDKTGKKLQEVQDTVDLAAKRTRTIGRKLKDVEEIGDVAPELSEGDDVAPESDDV